MENLQSRLSPDPCVENDSPDVSLPDVGDYQPLDGPDLSEAPNTSSRSAEPDETSDDSQFSELLYLAPGRRSIPFFDD